ncbi:TetR family transcriptional regulator [Duganella sp. FT80W]|uniref:TetR family transcriptional regulator n=1 Tax=Duganella guangzhouensis TaxID=2666084 RepID=A0A6I2KY60_9BURK|nr:TetR/AcrR family transcriptional regulator [Duganella guangzhouensis]MRW91075.1 TetR family transcriptional regulator [Duganella guangzhouensis]
MTDSKRKNPRQERARQTVDTILQTTAQILVEEGADKLTTNYLARKAGFSIGTIYQYFPHREAIVLALIERQREQARQRIAMVVQHLPKGGMEEKLRLIVRTLHHAFSLHRNADQRLTFALLRLAIAHGLPAPSDDLAEALVKVWQEGEGTTAAALNASETFVLTRALVEVLRHATLHGSPLLGTTEFEDALLRLVLGFLRASRDGSD